jgi:hypothetical protein
VEGSLFKVPRDSFVENSDFFRAMFQLPVPSGASPDGSSDEDPLRLEGIEKADFIQLLKVMFPRSVKQYVCIYHRLRPELQYNKVSATNHDHEMDAMVLGSQVGHYVGDG